MFAELITPEQLTILGQIIFIDLVLSRRQCNYNWNGCI